MLGELMAVVGLFNTTNSLVEGYQVESDVFPLVFVLSNSYLTWNEPEPNRVL